MAILVTQKWKLYCCYIYVSAHVILIATIMHALLVLDTIYNKTSFLLKIHYQLHFLEQGM